MPISPPTDPDSILSLVKDPGTRFDTDHLVVNRVATWLALDDQHAVARPADGGSQGEPGQAAAEDDQILPLAEFHLPRLAPLAGARPTRLPKE